MANDLKKTYFALSIPAFLGLILVYLLKTLDCFPAGQIESLKYIAPLTFVLSVVFAIALPIFFRTLFVHRIRHQKSTSEAELIKFERNFLYIALVAPYLMLIAYLLEFPRFYLAGTVLMALYAIYYYYPSKKRIQFERRIFRVK
ncbi:MAG: hypothetical protein U9N82_01715 [Thermodesulfobacteriota bacterium]|nr:hypothetical protein [Thermodesulfobacteriota bacterium]